MELFGRNVEKEVWEAVTQEGVKTDQELCVQIEEYYDTIFKERAHAEAIKS